MPQQRVTEADMWGATMFGELMCRIKFHQLRYDGPYTPPSLQGSLVFPGNYGVTDWGGMAVDPVRQIAFLNPNYLAFVDKLIPQNSAGDLLGGKKKADEHGLNANTGAPFAVDLNPFLSPAKFPCQAPPWGYVAGVDLRTGKTVWKHKNGTVRDEAIVPLPFKMGVPSLGGPIVTAGGVAFLTSALDYYIRAYDVTSGKVLWKDRLPAGGQSIPMTYRSPSGRQMVVTMAGGHGSLGTKMGDYLIAYALPEGTR
jgi:quinoprotein glucose dehydrogenase